MNAPKLGAVLGLAVLTTAAYGQRTAPARADLNDGLVAYWSFDEGSGSVLHDQSGNGHDGTVSGATWATGVSGGALYFNGSACVTFTEPVWNTPPYSFCAWAFQEDSADGGYVLANGAETGTCRGVSMSRGAPYQGYNCALDVRSTSLHGHADQPGQLGVWTFMCGTCDGSSIQGIRLYVNGVLVNSATAQSGGATAVANLRIGCPSDETPAVFFQGYIDETRIYNRVLSADEICRLYSDCAPATLVGDMNCDGTVDLADINPFVLYLFDLATWQATYCCPARNGDINQDGAYPDFGDINPFIALLMGQ